MEKDLEKNNSDGAYHYPPIVERYKEGNGQALSDQQDKVCTYYR